MLDMIRELEITCVAITETWFKGGAQLRQELGDVEQATGIKIICKNRASMKGTTRGGGVALAFNTMTWNFKERAIKNKGKHELLCAVGPIGKITRKVVIFGLYIPPKTTAARMSDLCDTLGEAIAGVKVALGNPILYVAGDINGHNIEPAFDVDPDITLLPTPPTRGTSTLDLVFANIPDLVDYAEVRPPLETEQGIPSDHGCVHVEATIPKQKNFVWMKKTTRKRSDSADERFAHDLDQTIWDFTLLKPRTQWSRSSSRRLQHLRTCISHYDPLGSGRMRTHGSQMGSDVGLKGKSGYTNELADQKHGSARMRGWNGRWHRRSRNSWMRWWMPPTKAIMLPSRNCRAQPRRNRGRSLSSSLMLTLEPLGLKCWTTSPVSGGSEEPSPWPNIPLDGDGGLGVLTRRELKPS